MFLDDVISGLIAYFYNLKYLKKEDSKFMGIVLIEPAANITSPGNCLKIYFLIFFASFTDFA